MICRPHNAPAVAQDIEAMICWMDETGPAASRRASTPSSTPPAPPARWSAACSTGSTSTPCTATRPPTELALNEIGRVRLRTTVPLLADEYRRNRTTGGFILIDETTNRTVGAGMIIESAACRGTLQSPGAGTRAPY